MAPKRIDLPALLKAAGKDPRSKNFWRGDRWFLSWGFSRDVSAYDFKLRVRNGNQPLFVAEVDGEMATVDMTNAATTPEDDAEHAHEIVIVVQAELVEDIDQNLVTCDLEADLDQTWFTFHLPVEGPRPVES